MGFDEVSNWEFFNKFPVVTEVHLPVLEIRVRKKCVHRYLVTSITRLYANHLPEESENIIWKQVFHVGCLNNIKPDIFPEE